MSEELEILILTGAPGVGKSTVANQWAKLKQGVAIEADEFTSWMHHKMLPRFSEKEEKLVAELTLNCAKTYLDYKLSVAISYVWSPQVLLFFKNQFENYFSNLNLKFIWLWCELNENHRRDGLRITDHRMGERVDIVNEWLGEQQWPAYVHKIISTHQSVNETVLEIEQIVKVES